MISVIYISTARQGIDAAALDDILARSRHNNAEAGITGMLVYTDGMFVQAVEGDETAVEALLARLPADTRHRDIVVIARYPVAARQFADWSMGFRRFDRAGPADLAEGFFSLRQPVFHADAVNANSIAHKLIEGVRQRSRG